MDEDIRKFLIKEKPPVDYRDIKLHIDVPQCTDEEDTKYSETPLLPPENVFAYGTVCEELPSNSQYTGIIVENSQMFQEARRLQSFEVDETLRDHETRLDNLESIVSQNVMLKIEREQKDREIELLKKQVIYLRGLVMKGDRKVENILQELHLNLDKKMPIIEFVYSRLKIIEANRSTQNSTPDENTRRNNRT